MADKFQSLFPRIFSEFDRLIKGEPSEKLSSRPFSKGRIAAAKLLGKKIAYYPFKTVFYVSYDFMLLILKIGELVGRLFTLCVPTGKRLKTFKATFFQTVDYAMLLPTIPLIQLAEIVKLLCAAIISPKLHFRDPSLFSDKVQARYYLKKSKEQFVILLRLGQERDLESKAALHELEKAVFVLPRNLKRSKSQRDYAVNCDRHLNSLRRGINKKKLMRFRDYLLKLAKKRNIELAIPFPY